MNLQSNQWHVRLFLWCLSVWDAFLDTHTNRDQTNLCHYIRTIFVSAPLALLAQAALVGWAGYVLVWYPYTRFGAVTYAWIVGIIVMVIVAVVAFRMIQEWLANRPRPHRRLRSIPHPAEERSAQETKPKGPGLLKLVWDWLVARKQKICPVITIEDSDSNLKQEVA